MHEAEGGSSEPQNQTQLSNKNLLPAEKDGSPSWTKFDLFGSKRKLQNWLYIHSLSEILKKT